MQIFAGNILFCENASGIPTLRYNPDSALLIDSQGSITAAGSLAELRKTQPKAKLVDCRGKLLLPGLIDTHIHFPQMDMMGSMAASLLPWLEQYTFPTEIAYRGQNATLHAAAQLFVDELLKNGTTLACVYSSSDGPVTDLLFEAFARRGMRGIIGKTSMDRHAPPELCVPVEQDIPQQEMLLKKWHRYENRLFLALTPRFAPSCTDGLMQELAGFHAANPDTFVQTHYAENEGELQWISELYPHSRDYLDVYESFRLLGPRTILAHGIHVSTSERTRLAATRTILSHCPTSNLFLGSGLYNWRAMRASGVATTLGTDVGAGTSFSLWQTMNEAYKVSALRGERLTATDLFAAATIDAAQALGFPQLGSLAVGFQADIQCINADAKPILARHLTRAQKPEDILGALMHHADDRCVEQVWVAGRSA